MKIAFLDLSNDNGADADKAILALKRKYKPGADAVLPDFSGEGNAITPVRLLNTYIAHMSGANPDVGEFKKICNSADKIMLSIHGPMKDIEYGLIRCLSGGITETLKTDNRFVIEDDPKEPKIKVHYRDLAALLRKLLDSNRAYKLTLVMCFGARTDAYAAKHIPENQDIDWTKSFACNFYRELCKGFNNSIVMTARTGELSFDPETGVSQVQTEKNIKATLAQMQAETNPLVTELRDWYETKYKIEGIKDAKFKKFIFGLEGLVGKARGKDDEDTLQKVIEGIAGEKTEKDAETSDRLIAFLTYRKEAVKLGKKRKEIKSKYGKLIFSIIDDQVMIEAKYPNKVLLKSTPL